MIQQTTIQSYETLDMSLTEKMRYCIIEFLKQSPMTDLEICSYFTDFGLKLEPRARRNELVKEKKVFPIGKKVQSNHKKGIVWAVSVYKTYTTQGKCGSNFRNSSVSS